MSDTESANPISCAPLNHVLMMQYNPDFTDISPTVAEKKHSRFLESLFKSPGYDCFWHNGIGFTGMHEAVCRRRLGHWISELPIKYLPSLPELEFLAYDIFRTYPLNTDIVSLSYIGREECLAGTLFWQRRDDGERGYFKEWLWDHPIDFDSTEPGYIGRRFERIEECRPNNEGPFPAPPDYHSKIRYDKKEILL